MMDRPRTLESQNQIQIDRYREKGPVRLGAWTSHIWRQDPRHLGFLLARYKFVTKILSGKEHVLEVGCGDGMGIPVVLQSVKRVHGIDFEPLVLNDTRVRFEAEGEDRATFEVHDIVEGPVEGRFDAAYSLDVIEHVPRDSEGLFLQHICAGLPPEGVCVLGTPNVEAERYASAASAEGHINLKSADTLRSLLLLYFENVFVFSMNDEVVHTGFAPMAHYLLAVAAGLRR